MELTVILVNYNTSHLLDEVLAALGAACRGLETQVIVVDNASADGSVEILRMRYPEVELIVNETNVGFGRANNQAWPQARGRHVLLLNTDAFVEPESLTRTLACMQAHPDCGILGVRLVSRDGSLQPSCRYFPTPWNSFIARTGLTRFFPKSRLVDDLGWDHASLRECDWVPGCFYLVRREVIEQVGLFDPRFFLYYEEVDHCRVAKQAGWKVLYCPDTSVVHIGGESAKSVGELTGGRQLSALQIESEMLYFRKHYGLGGVVAGVMLNALADLVLAAKWLLKGRGVAGARAHWANIGIIGTLFARTAWGTRPTR